MFRYQHPTPQDPAAAAQMFLASVAQQGTFMSTPGYNIGNTVPGSLSEFGPMAALGQPLLNSAMAQLGLYPGQFTPSVNLADVMRAENYRRQMSEVTARAMQTTDTEAWLATTRGTMRMLGQPYGLDQQAGFRQAYRQAAPLLSVLAGIAPELVDQLHGPRGSAAVMAQHLFRGGQYRMDGAGRMGLSGEDLRELTDTIGKRLYGTPEDTAEMRGIGMGQLGLVFDEAQRRGYLPGTLGARSRDGQLAALSRETGKTTAELAKLDDAEFGRQLRQFDANRVSARLKELAGSVSAMRELFGTMGQPNAPMTQIINALEAITQNRLANMPAAQVEQTVRKTKALIETTGTSLDALLATTTRAAAYGDQLGLDRSFAVGAGQHAVGYGAAYKNAFGSSFSAFGALGADELTQREALFQQRAAASEQARYGGAVIRSVEGLGIGANTPLGRLAEALRSGATEFDGRSMFEVLRRDNLIGMMQQSGAKPADVASFMTAMEDKFGNQELIQKYDIGGMVRKLQPQEVTQRMGQGAGELALMPALMNMGMSQEQARQRARTAAPTLLNALLNSEEPEKLSTRAGRQEIIQKALTQQFGAAAAAQMAGPVALSFETHMNRQAQHYGFGDMTKLLQSQNRTVLRQEAQIQRQANAEADIDRMLSPLGRSGPIARVIGMLQEGRNDQDIMQSLGQAMGGIPIADIRKLMAARDAFMTAKMRPGQSAEDVAAAANARERLLSNVRDIVKRGRDAGVDIGRHIDDETVKRAVGSGDEVAKALAGDPAKRQDATNRAVRLQLARANNLVQGLYLDDESVRKLGPGAVDRLRSIEGKYTQMLRIAGDPDRIAKALAGDESIDKETRTRIQQLQASLTREMGEVGERLTGRGQRMSDAEFAAEKKKLKALREEREADDDTQTKGIIDRLATLGGMDPKALSDDDRKALRGQLGGFGETKRKDIMLAVAARERLQKAAAAKGVSVADLRKDQQHATDFEQAGSLGEFAAVGKDDVAGMSAALRGFGPSAKTLAGRKEVTISGTLRVTRDGTASIAGVGYTDMDGDT